MRYNKIYFQKDAIEREEDFDVWYEDGDVLYHVQSNNNWANEKSQVQLIGRMGGQVGTIRYNPEGSTYFIRLERWEYKLRTHHIFRHYYIEGMMWDVRGSLTTPPFNFVNESTDKKDAHVRLVNFRDKGECYEIKVKDLNKLRVAAASLIAIGFKEHHKGLSEGYDDPDAGRIKKLIGNLGKKGLTYEEVLTKEDYLISVDEKIQAKKAKARAEREAEKNA